MDANQRGVLYSQYPAENSAGDALSQRDALLARMERMGDPLGEQTVRFMAEDLGIDEFLSFMLNLVRLPGLDQLESLHLNDASTRKLKDYMEQSGRMPAWADMHWVGEGESLFREQVFLSFIVLCFASLPMCYSCVVPARILGMTGRLVEEVPRRIPETAQTVVDVMRRGGLRVTDGYGTGIRAMQKVRLIHAGIRLLLSIKPEQMFFDGGMLQSMVAKNPFAQFLVREVHVTSGHFSLVSEPALGWNVEKDGVPISQAHMGATLLSFSYLILRGLQKMGVRLSAREQRAYLHSWNVAGHFMGVSRELTEKINTMEDSEILYRAALNRYQGSAPAETSAMLTHAIVDYIKKTAKQNTPILYRVTPLARLPKILIFHLAGPQTFHVCGLTLDAVDHLIRWPAWWTVQCIGFLKNFSPFQAVSRVFFKWLARHVWSYRRGASLSPAEGARKGVVRLPDDIADHWKIKDEAGKR